MPQNSRLCPGCAYTFDYPRYNYSGLPTKTEQRRIVVESIRDMQQEPPDAVTVSANPLLRRGRWLVTGRDLDRDAMRSFYVNAMTRIRPLIQMECATLPTTEYVVLDSTGRTTFQTTRIGEALSFLIGRKVGVLCKVLGIRAVFSGNADAT